MKNRTLPIILILSATLLFVTACSSGTPAPTTTLDGATLLQERCTVCHPISYIERSRHTAADWQTIVGMMISRGAQLTPQEESSVVTYLAANFGQ